MLERNYFLGLMGVDKFSLGDEKCLEIYVSLLEVLPDENVGFSYW